MDSQYNFSYSGSDVKVLEPKELKEKVHKILIEAVRNY